MFEAAPGINYQNCSEISKYHLKIVWVDPLEHILKGSKYTHMSGQGALPCQIC